MLFESFWGLKHQGEYPRFLSIAFLSPADSSGIKPLSPV
jgi:hypothetical protein